MGRDVLDGGPHVPATELHTRLRIEDVGLAVRPRSARSAWMGMARVFR